MPCAVAAASLTVSHRGAAVSPPARPSVWANVRCGGIAYTATGLATMLCLGVVAGTQANAADPTITFPMVRSATAVSANCLPAATATVRVVSHGQNETMILKDAGLPALTEFDLFITRSG
jgi:hypothetical protein